MHRYSFIDRACSMTDSLVEPEGSAIFISARARKRMSAAIRCGASVASLASPTVARRFIGRNVRKYCNISQIKTVGDNPFGEGGVWFVLLVDVVALFSSVLFFLGILLLLAAVHVQYIFTNKTFRSRFHSVIELITMQDILACSNRAKNSESGQGREQ